MAFFDYNLREEFKKYTFGAYFRRSSEDNEDKQMRSIEGQQQDIEELIKKLSLKGVKLFPPESKSAFKEGRPIFSEVIRAIEEGKIDALIVWHSNRIARNYGDGGKFVQLMSDGKLKVVLTPHGLFENTGRDREYLMTEFTRATRDSDDKSEAVKRGNRTKLKDGYIPNGRLAEGLIHMKNDKGEFINTSDPLRFPLLRKAIELLLEGTHTPMEALNALNNDMGYRTRRTRRSGGNPLSKSTWYKMLNDPKFTGQIVRTEGEFKANFPALMSSEEFGKIQILLGRNATRRKTKKDWAYTGEITCESCGGFITMEDRWQIICPYCKIKFHVSYNRFSCPNCNIEMEEMKDPTVLHYVHLHCTKKVFKDGTRCKQPALDVEYFEEQVQNLIEQFSIPKSFSGWAIKWLQELHEVEVEDRTKIKESLQNLDVEIQSQLDELLDLKLKLLIEEVEYQKKRESLLLEQKQVREKLNTTDKRADEWLDLCERTFDFATYAHIWFEKGDSQQKRAILHALGSDLTLNNRILSIRQRKPFMILNGMKEKYGVLLETIEPNDSVATITQKAPSYVSVPSLLPGLDSNQD